MVITAGNMPLILVKFSKSSSCGNITSDSCVPLVTVTLSERITIKAGRKFGIILMRFLDATSIVKEVHTNSLVT